MYDGMRWDYRLAAREQTLETMSWGKRIELEYACSLSESFLDDSVHHEVNLNTQLLTVHFLGEAAQYLWFSHALWEAWHLKISILELHLEAFSA
jgi:hypothetical protein